MLKQKEELTVFSSRNYATSLFKEIKMLGYGIDNSDKQRGINKLVEYLDEQDISEPLTKDQENIIKTAIKNSLTRSWVGFFCCAKYKICFDGDNAFNKYALREKLNLSKMALPSCRNH